MMTPQQIGHRRIEAFNQHDVAVLICFYARDAMHSSPKLRAYRPETDGQIFGHLALAGWWQDTFQRLPGLRYELLSTRCSDERAFIECIRHVSGEEPTAVAEMFEVERGLIISSIIYNGYAPLQHCAIPV